MNFEILENMSNTELRSLNNILYRILGTLKRRCPKPGHKATFDFMLSDLRYQELQSLTERLYYTIENPSEPAETLEAILHNICQTTLAKMEKNREHWYGYGITLVGNKKEFQLIQQKIYNQIQKRQQPTWIIK